jgi:hypothetical protein
MFVFENGGFCWGFLQVPPILSPVRLPVPPPRPNVHESNLFIPFSLAKSGIFSVSRHIAQNGQKQSQNGNECYVVLRSLRISPEIALDLFPPNPQSLVPKSVGLQFAIGNEPLHEFRRNG